MASSALYLGYVEDDESVEMILRKFQKLEELQRVKGGGKAGTAGEGGDSGPAGEEEGLSLEEQEELFRETSYFSVRKNRREGRWARTRAPPFEFLQPCLATGARLLLSLPLALLPFSC